MKITTRLKTLLIAHPMFLKRQVLVIKETTTVVYEILNDQGEWVPADEGAMIKDNEYLSCEDN